MPRLSSTSTKHGAAYAFLGALSFIRGGTAFVVAGRGLASWGGCEAAGEAHQPNMPRGGRRMLLSMVASVKAQQKCACPKQEEDSSSGSSSSSS
eukprot:g15471.t1